ncbi:hypothetical protein AMECASPLE_011213 [Ameca splendens]|uniref:Uncharacterized protein n=1 Tax=Ameca splendens TaxID=208324 RepID=A0ABV0ZWL9_9TELE
MLQLQSLLKFSTTLQLLLPLRGLLNAPACASMSQRDVSSSPEQPSSLQSFPDQPSITLLPPPPLEPQKLLRRSSVHLRHMGSSLQPDLTVSLQAGIPKGPLCSTASFLVANLLTGSSEGPLRSRAYLQTGFFLGSPGSAAGLQTTHSFVAGLPVSFAVAFVYSLLSQVLFCSFGFIRLLRFSFCYFLDFGVKCVSLCFSCRSGSLMCFS